MSGELKGDQSISQVVSVAIVKRPYISEAVKAEVLEREYIPEHSGGINIGWSAAKAVIILENNSNPNDRAKLESNLREKIGWGRKTLEFLDAGGYSGGEFDKFMIDEKVLPSMNEFFKRKTGLESGFLESVEEYFRNKKGHRLGWKLEENGQEKTVVDYIGMLAGKDDSGDFIIPNEMLLDFLRSYNYVIAQKSLEISTAAPKIISIFKSGITLAVEGKVIPESAKRELSLIDGEIDGFSFGDPLERASLDYVDAVNEKVTTNDSSTVNERQKKSHLKFFRYDELLGHMPYHELLHLIEGDYIKRIFNGLGSGINISEAMTERLALSIFGDGPENELGVTTVGEVSRKDNLNGGAYLKDREVLDKMLQESSDGDRLYELLTELYFAEDGSIEGKDLDVKKQELFGFISNDMKQVLHLV
jgi:hypothetical protein